MVLASIEPPRAAVSWAADVAGACRATVGGRLLGGTHAVTHIIRTSSPAREMVLRRFPPGDDAARREAHVLALLDGLGGFAPRLLAADTAGERFGEPALLISRVAGSPNLRPQDVGAWTESLATALARIHSHPDRAAAFAECMPTSPPARSLAGPAAKMVIAAWQQLQSGQRVLTHFDFWSGNLLWTGDTVSGIVDWSGACQAPRGFDVGWCRLDLALLHGPRCAREFLDAYDSVMGTKMAHVPLWDLYASARSHRDVASWSENYRQLGRIDLTPAVLRERHDRWTASAMKSLDDS